MSMRLVYTLLLALFCACLNGCFPVVAVGMGAGALLAQDRRTSGAYVEDSAIELKVNDKISKQYPANVHVNVTSFNRNVLLSGQAPTDAVKMEIGKLAFGIENVRNVHNELVVSGVSSFTSRASDTMITSDVKMRFMNDKRFSADHVKVITEGGMVFLMGIVKHQEANAAAEVASTTGGVMRVVKLFEYLD
jgi:osmotically-inducible protein OsmY